MILIIAEKPSLARNITSAIGALNKKNGYFEGNEYIVTWAFGHLFSLCDIEEYGTSSSESGNVKWTMDNLPFFPQTFRFKLRMGADKKPDEGVIRQFNTIKMLCNREDVDTIINAGDSDREGEIIIRLCIENALDKPKRLLRLWMPDQTPETIRAGLLEMRSEDEFDNLANEGFARTYIDWLYGVNLTRYATLKTGTLLRVGRVIVPIVKAIYDRDMEIKNFVPGIYYALVSAAETNGEVVELTSKTKFSNDRLEEALEACARLNAQKVVVTNKKVKKDKLEPGKLYSLSKLQNYLGKKYKMSMAQSLEIVQKLYEEGYVTYPRTNSEYLACAEQDKIKKVIAAVKGVGYPVEFKFKKTIFDDSKIESHSALTPTYKIPDKNKLSEDEMKVYSAIIRRFVAVFCAEECKIEKTEIKIDAGGIEEFVLKGNVIVEKGWTKYDDYTTKDKLLPNLNKGDEVAVDFKPVEKETTPPKHYTIETLNNYLKNPFREEKAAAKEALKEAQNAQGAEDTTLEENDDDDYRAIFEGLELGTEATRTSIIDNARKSGYIELKKDVYHILPGGIYLIESLGRMQISMDKYKTSEMGKALKKVYRGEIGVVDGVLLAENEIREVFRRKQATVETDTDDGFYGDIAGKCPICSSDVVKGKYGYYCQGYKDGCKFSVNTSICGRVISKSNVIMLLENGRTSKIQGFISKKTGKSFDAYLKLEEGEVKFDFSN